MREFLACGVIGAPSAAAPITPRQAVPVPGIFPKEATMELHELPEAYSTTRVALHRLATHVLARRRAALCGKFGLRATPGGIGTPACGPEHEVVRIAGTRLIREISGPISHTSSLELTSATLLDAADLVGVDLTEPFEAGPDSPPFKSDRTSRASSPPLKSSSSP